MNRTSEMEHILICLKEHIALSDDEDNLLLDYIINLQKENEMLKDNAIHNDKVVDKAIEYIKEHIRIDDEYPAYMEMLVEERDNLLNILQNEINKGE